MKRLLKLISASIVALALPVTLLGSPLVNAQASTANGFKISPVRNEITIEPGKSQVLTITIENPTGLPVTAKLIVNDFMASDTENGEPRLVLDDLEAPKHSLRKLVGQVPNISLGPKERKDVNVTVSIPASASAGGYYGAVRFTPVSDNNGSTVGLTASVGSLILVKVPGNLHEKLELAQFSAATYGKPKSFIIKGEPSMVTRIKNSGDIHLKPFGRITVKNMFGKVVDTTEINNTDPRSNILPESTRKFENKLKKQTWFGRYTATASIAYEQGGGDIINAKTAFWYVPTWLVITLVVILILIMLAAYLGYRRMMRNHRRHNRTLHR